MQAPLAALQTKGHAVPAAVHWPLSLQTSGTSRLHRAAPGVQTPVHVPVPESHTKGHAEGSDCHWPVALQVCG